MKYPYHNKLIYNLLLLMILNFKDNYMAGLLCALIHVEFELT
jgi:hypothetical protein